MSAVPSGQPQAEQVAAELARRHPVTWGVREVAAWVELIGLGQYRKKFTHHCIDGRLLLQLTDTSLKVGAGLLLPCCVFCLSAS
jgi:hypothetical protein